MIGYRVTIKIIIFIVFITFLLWRIINNLFFPSRRHDKKRQFIAKKGHYKFLIKSLYQTIILILFCLLAYLFAYYPTFWFILSIVFAFMVLCETLIIFNKRYKDLHVPNHESSNKKIIIKGRRIIALLDIFLLLMWIISWRYLL